LDLAIDDVLAELQGEFVRVVGTGRGITDIGR
jgi:hypothetical protein